MTEATQEDWECVAKEMAVTNAGVYLERGALKEHAEALAEELEALTRGVINPPAVLVKYRTDYPIEDLGPDA